MDDGKPNDREAARVPFLARLIATGFYSGYIPWAPGTWGSIVGIILYAIPGAEQALIPMILLGFVGGTLAARKVADAEGHRLTRMAELTKSVFQPGTHDVVDPSIVVVDEIVGMWIALLWLPKEILPVILAFVFFRIFDIVKPEPARMVEKIPYGLGIMLDDAIAGIYANLATHVLYYIFLVTFHGT
jgi:phosphatidylglycerophosphatase A